MNKQIRSKAIAAGAIIFWLIVWQITAAVVNRGLLIPIPTPVSTVAALVRILTDAESLTAVGLSVLRILAGFVCALIAGTILAVLSARFTVFRVLTEPLVQLVVFLLQLCKLGSLSARHCRSLLKKGRC